jgi:hypothetical protein
VTDNKRTSGTKNVFWLNIDLICEVRVILDRPMYQLSFTGQLTFVTNPTRLRPGSLKNVDFIVLVLQPALIKVFAIS